MLAGIAHRNEVRTAGAGEGRGCEWLSPVVSGASAGAASEQGLAGAGVTLALRATGL